MKIVEKCVDFFQHLRFDRKRDTIEQLPLGSLVQASIEVDEEYFKELNRKLKEELNEYLDGNDIEELADLYEVMLAILDYKKMSLMEFDIIRKMKVEKRGAFKNKIYLESVIDNK